jgi:hypothetical protein
MAKSPTSGTTPSSEGNVAADPAEPSEQVPSPHGVFGEVSVSAKVRSLSDADLRIGPFELIKTLVDAPGSSFVEGRDSEARQWLIQVAALRAPRDDNATTAIRDYIQMIDVATKHLANDPDIKLEAHGAIKRSDGKTALYWALPWPEDAYRLGHAKAYIASLEDLTSIARSLLVRMASRHDRGRLEPLLSEQLIIVRSKGGAELVGIPIHLPLGELAEEMVPARLAPEERVSREPGLSGDLWRLGMALKELAKSVEGLPPAFTRLLEKLTHSNVESRIETPRDALAELVRLGSGHEERTKVSVPEKTVQLDKPVLPAEGTIAADGLGLAHSEDTEDSSGSAGRDATAESEPADGDDTLDDKTLALGGESGEQDTIAIPIPKSSPKENPTIEDMKTIAEKDLGDQVRAALKRKQARSEAAERAETIKKIAASPTVAEPNVVAEKRRRMAQKSGAEGEVGPRPEPPPRASPPSIAELKARLEARARAEEDLKTLADKPTARSLLGGDTLVDNRVPESLRHREPSDVDLANMQTIVPAKRANTFELPMLKPDDDPARAVLSAISDESRAPPRDTVWDQAKARTSPKPSGPPARGPKGTVMGLRPLGPQGTVVGVRPLGAQFRIVSIRNEAADGDDSPPQLTADPKSQDPRLFMPSIEDMPAESRLALPEGRREPPIDPANASTVDAPPPPEVVREVEIAEPWRRYVVDVLAVIICSVALAFVFHRFWPAPSTPKESVLRRINDTMEVRLDVTPPEAIVVAEESGRILGGPPLTFLLPPGSQTAVLIAAKNFEPQRIVLPDRGQVSTSLLPLEYHDPCDVDLRVPPGVVLEPMGGTFEVTKMYKIPSALVLRSLNGNGAWLVRCPLFGGSDAQTLPARSPKSRITLSVTEPKDSAVYVDDKNLGAAPVETSTGGGFFKLQVGEGDAAVTRWLPAFEDTDVRLAKPKP